MIMSLVQFIFELCNSMLLHPDVLIRLRSVPSASIYSITNTLIKYSYTLASASIANEKTHIVVRLSFDNLSCSYCLSGDTTYAILLCANLPPRASSQRSESEKRFHCSCHRNENEKTRDFSTLFPLDFVLFSFSSFFRSSPFFLFILVSHIYLSGDMTIFLGEIFITSRQTVIHYADPSIYILYWMKIYPIIEYYNFLKIFIIVYSVTDNNILCNIQSLIK